MKLPTSLPLIVLLLVVLGVLLLVSTFHIGERGVSYDPEALDYNTAYWKQEIQKTGAEKAYAEFKEKNATAPENRQHLGAHVIGERIYTEKGAEGITVCDASFGFGCYHGLFARAIAEGGVETIQALDAKCVATYGELGTGCQHGIGHGILEYVGYQEIERALSLCNTKTTQKVPLLGCTSGVFMEYNVPLVEQGEGLTPSTRKLDMQNPYEPCHRTQPVFQKSCYYELGQWYPRMLAQSHERAGELCAGLMGDARTYCYLGIGASAAHDFQYRMEEGIALCDSFQTVDAVSCRAGLSWGFYEVPEQRSEYVRACELPRQEDATTCRTLSDLTLGRDSSRIE